jgi:3-oxoacyl-[acyl-carrier-protein] synthase I
MSRGMTQTLDIVMTGAVTSVGLDAAQTCAAIRAGLARFSAVRPLPPPEEPLLGAAVPARRHVKSSPTVWLANLAARALRECLRPGGERGGRVALLLVVPEPARRHPAFDTIDPESFRASLGKYLGQDFHERSCTVPAGHAGTQQALALADQLFGARAIDECIIGGVDSLLNDRDLERLTAAHRLGSPSGQVAVPGEAAAFVRLRPAAPKGVAIARILGSGLAQEIDAVDGERWSQGRGLEAALAAATNAAGVPEANLSLRISDMNGERYKAWETVLSEFRFYRTQRPALPTWYPAASVGDVGAASGALQLVIAATAMARGYAPGPLAMCETGSDAGLRGASVIGPAASAPTPPFASVRAWFGVGA